MRNLSLARIVDFAPVDNESWQGGRVSATLKLVKLRLMDY